MAVVFKPGDTLGRGDLDIFLTNIAGNPTNAAQITYSLYYVDPGPPEAEVLIGAADRTPVNPAVGEYYASLMVPPTATVGTYRIRWNFRELLTSPLQQVVQEFAIVVDTTAIAPSPYSQCETDLIYKLRVFLRDQCVGGEEEVELDVGGERMIVRMDDLWDTLQPSSTAGQ
ncbi:MAG: hypothetical protein A2Y38_19455 [Spirochaetes bacterium GWB1_59_5]|nr:MAG: hypothetical protein A2Y38_19455 [Spirochaetes bacterium GWB1_59_5]